MIQVPCSWSWTSHRKDRFTPLTCPTRPILRFSISGMACISSCALASTLALLALCYCVSPRMRRVRSCGLAPARALSSHISHCRAPVLAQAPAALLALLFHCCFTRFTACGSSASKRLRPQRLQHRLQPPAAFLLLFYCCFTAAVLLYYTGAGARKSLRGGAAAARFSCEEALRPSSSALHVSSIFSVSFGRHA
jgi:hypothetical protein